jgi:hypothetical protein
VLQLPERGEKRAEPVRKSMPFFGSTEYGDGTGAPKDAEHCPVEDIYNAGIDPDFPKPGAKPEVRTERDGLRKRACCSFAVSLISVCGVCDLLCAVCHREGSWS